MQSFNGLLKYTAATLFLVLAWRAENSFGQMQVHPLQRHILQAPNARQISAGRTKEDMPPLSLPFWDDFSNPYGIYPDTLRWERSYSVWVNDDMGINQPTINVATFDGLDSVGIAYNPTDILVTGYTDQMTSRRINLNEVPEALRNTVYLSFFYQWQGNGEAPDRDDYLELQFLNKDRQWETMISIYPERDFQADIFYDTSVQVSAPGFFHEGFQFRFRSFGRQSGPYDTWNIDYVYLNDERTADDTSFPERAAASDATSLFGKYLAIPYRHFKHNMVLDTPRFDVQNLKKNITPVSINYSARAIFLNHFNDDSVAHSATLISSEASQGVKGSTGIMFPQERTTVRLAKLPDVNDPLQFNPEANGVDITLKFKVISGDSVDQDRVRFEPINFQVNDTISSSYYLRNYYAYDDGEAEYTAGLIEPGNQVAYQFDMLSYVNGEFVPDTLIAIDVYFPAYAITTDQTISFYIYHDDNGKPGEVWEAISSVRIAAPKKANEFFAVRFTPAILIDEPRFYLGWRQPIAGKALIGLDIDNDTGDRIFVNTNGFWYQNDAVRGSLMIRPVFGKGVIETLQVGTEEEKISESHIYPNPSNGSFFIDEKFEVIKVYTSTGVEVPCVIEQLEKGTLIRLQQPSGVYLLKLTRNKITQTRKIVITR